MRRGSPTDYRRGKSPRRRQERVTCPVRSSWRSITPAGVSDVTCPVRSSWRSITPAGVSEMMNLSSSLASRASAARQPCLCILEYESDAALPRSRTFCAAAPLSVFLVSACSAGELGAVAAGGACGSRWRRCGSGRLPIRSSSERARSFVPMTIASLPTTRTASTGCRDPSTVVDEQVRVGEEGTLQPGRGESRPRPLTRDAVSHRIQHA